MPWNRANPQRPASGSLTQPETPIDYDGVNLNLRMTDNSKKALMSNCDTACDAITEGALAILSTKLKDKGHLTKVDVQEINAQPLLYNKNHKLLAILSTRTERAFVDFIEMLPTVNFGWLADKILQEELTNMLSNEANPQRSPSGLQTQNGAEEMEMTQLSSNDPTVHLLENEVAGPSQTSPETVLEKRY
uniref:Uncharacterized protein n=1 Tax=Plectus sambesii TaxID=2011161 RepID=A0A914WVM9_9BILA